MTQPPGPRPHLDVRGAVDLSGLGRPPAPAPGGPAASASGVVVDVTEATFADVVQQSVTVPVVVVLWAPWSEVSATVTAALVAIAEAAGGRFLLARVDTDQNPQIAQAFAQIFTEAAQQPMAVPSVVALLKGQPVPLFQRTASLAEMRA
ncbi:MAG TPA: thioredoxin domain-containing protein, partial [Actinotalea sp.]|nr:thioredoxin domain-containing protein [Actinotalea sp.]